MLEFNKIYLGNCLEVMKDIEDKSIDMILCDLPYGTTACSWDSIIPFEPLWVQYKRVIKSGGAIVLNASQPFTSALIMSNPKMFKYVWIWVKSRPTGFLNANKQPMRKNEDIIVFSEKTCNYYPQGLVKKDKQNKNTGVENVYGKVKKDWIQDVTYTNYPTNILEFPSVNKSIHPTQKPIALCEYLIKTYTNERDLVLDNCSGSGTTGIACINTNRRYILIEQDPIYFEMANNRLSEHLRNII
jgi:site-specific DNA-methyltransferase (adenine-specific)